jgi:hypothetical protein
MVEENADFGDTALHDQEIRVVDIKLYALKDGLDDVLLGLMTI